MAKYAERLKCARGAIAWQRPLDGKGMSRWKACCLNCSRKLMGIHSSLDQAVVRDAVLARINEAGWSFDRYLWSRGREYRDVVLCNKEGCCARHGLMNEATIDRHACPVIGECMSPEELGRKVKEASSNDLALALGIMRAWPPTIAKVSIALGVVEAELGLRGWKDG